jgi:hypothetical protein
MPDCSGEPVVTTSCAFYFAHETAGAARIRHSLRPPFVLGEQFLHHSGASRGENAEVWFKALGCLTMESTTIHSGTVIPGCAIWRRPGIHNPELWLWIPGSMLRIAPE